MQFSIEFIAYPLLLKSIENSIIKGLERRNVPGVRTERMLFRPSSITSALVQVVKKKLSDKTTDWCKITNSDQNTSLNTSKMRIELVILGSIVLSTSVVGNAYYQKKQFYPSVVHITKSNPSMMVKNKHLIQVIFKCCLTYVVLSQVMYIQALVIVVLMGKLMKRIFFGQLRAAEVEVKTQALAPFHTHSNLKFIFSTWLTARGMPSQKHAWLSLYSGKISPPNLWRSLQCSSFWKPSTGLLRTEWTM